MIIVLDTNILVRYALKDDPIPTAIATQWLTNHDCYVLNTVWLEVVWVLSSKRGYALPKELVIDRIRHILALPRVYTESLEEISWALEWYTKGMDFADALHLASSLRTGERFATFDKDLVRQARLLKVSQSILWLSERFKENEPDD